LGLFRFRDQECSVFVIANTGQLVPERAEQFTGLRSLLHYLHLDGRTARQLASVVPAVPG